MQNDPQQCSPEVLSSLQKAFDEIWRSLEADRSVYVFPWDAQASRERIAVELCRRIDELLVDPDSLKQDVLRTFGAGSIQPPTGRLRQQPLSRQETRASIRPKLLIEK